MNKLIVIALYIISLTLLNLSIDSINFNTVSYINPWIGLTLSFLSLAIAYAIMHREWSNPSYSWKAKDFVRK